MGHAPRQQSRTHDSGVRNGNDNTTGSPRHGCLLRHRKGKNTASSQAAGGEFLQRLGERTTDHDAPSSLATRDHQLTAWSEWGIPDKSKFVRLNALFQPTLVADGESDILMPAKNSHLLAKYLPDAQLHIYPDAGHGFLYQYAVKFGTEVNTFLDR
ncbi:alpha/beta hydrolase [Streptomyces canus]|uniref:alpha/beta fold hydrolase n=1 Tax=Streptomyces canus TaxID=58343 RepID=UPI003409A45A